MGTAVVWLRGLLRLHDNPILSWASCNDEVDSIIPIFIIEEDQPEGYGAASASRLRFLYESLSDLDKSLRERYDANLLIFSGNPRDVIVDIAEKLNPGTNWLLTDYRSEPWMRKEIHDIELLLNETDIKMMVFPSVNTILNIEEVTSSDSYKNPKSSKDIRAIFSENLDCDPSGFIVGRALPAPIGIKTDSKLIQSLINSAEISKFHVTMDEVSLRSSKIRGTRYFIGGEREALERLRNKIAESPEYVNKFRKPETVSTNEIENPSEPTTTGLSPYISTGCLSVRLVWNEVARINSRL